MQELVIVFLLGCIGTAIRYYLSEKGKYFLLLANCIGVIVAAICVTYGFDLILAGFCGSITTLSTLVYIGFTDFKYYLITIFVNIGGFYLIINLLNI